MLFYLPIALTALATTLYHIAQKSIVPGGVTFVRSIKELNWATYVVGLSIVGWSSRCSCASGAWS